ncbi:SAM-dependent methyltransferase [Actinocrispum sp. NPDC049592]|uniref:SAM-dependent methyltransferase n=1 Tax=Actinocrispum sp. NPDC049592 TaxID=3154835 RepID=UPI00342F4024
MTDPHAANIARVYDALLGGKDNYEADREARDQLAAQAPEISAVAMDNRLFMMRAARFLAGGAGIGQFIDFGPCLPIGENMHEVVQRLNREANVVYVGIDPLVIAHGRALLADNEQTHMVEIDWRHPENVLADDTLHKYIDFGQPVAIFQVATLNHVADEYEPARIMSVLIDALAPGSYVVFAHMLDPGEGHELHDVAARVQAAGLTGTIGTGWFRTAEQLAAMTAGLEFVEPGLVPVAEWWPDGPRVQPLAPLQHLLVGGVARKP